MIDETTPARSAAADPGGAPATPLEDALLAAHAKGDTARLVTLYAEAARLAEAERRDEAAAFYLTHAYVFALETGHDSAPALHARLRALGREE